MPVYEKLSGRDPLTVRASRSRLQAHALFTYIVLSLSLVLGWVTPAGAQVNDGALAEELFRQGRALMAEERYGEACPKLAESQRLDPSTGTLLNLAVCHEKQGKLATAWSEFTEARLAARRDGRADRVSFAEEHIAAIEPRLSRLTIVLPEAHDVSGLGVELDGTEVGRPAFGVALPVDPGAHLLSVSAPGKKVWQSTVEILEGPASQTITIPRLIDVAPEPAALSPVSVDLPEAPRPTSARRMIAYGLGGLGAVGLGLGTYWGLDARDKYDQSNEAGCVGNDCGPTGARLRSDARTAGNLSTVAFVAGLAAVSAGVVLYLTAPSDAEPGQVAWRARMGSGARGTTAELVATW